MDKGDFALRILLERLRQVEALLHVIVAWTLGVNVSDAAVASIDSAVLLQSLDRREEPTGRELRETKTLSTCDINHPRCHRNVKNLI